MAYRFTPLQAVEMRGLISQLNKNFSSLDKEAVVKKFGNDEQGIVIGRTGDGKYGMRLMMGGKIAIEFGIYDDARAGLLLYQDGVPITLIGMAPDDGRQGQWQVKPGQNVITQLGG